MELTLHISSELFASVAPAHTMFFGLWSQHQDQSSPAGNTAKMAPDRALIEEKFVNCSLAEHRLTREAYWQMKHKDKSKRQSANVLKLVPIPFSSALPTPPPSPPHPYSPTPSTQLPFSSLSICLWICHYGNLTPGAGEEGASFRSSKGSFMMVCLGIVKHWCEVNMCVPIHMFGQRSWSIRVWAYLHMTASCRPFVLKQHSKYFEREKQN